MQLTGPAFLFLFLPLSLLIVFLLPKAYRRLCLSLLSVLWYIAANANNSTGLIHIALLVSFSVVMAYLPMPHSVACAKLRTGVRVAVPILSFLTARLLLEYGDLGYTYPAGLLFVTLASVSFAIDQARGDVLRPRNPLELIGYLLFFPVLTLGPVLRSKQYFDMTEDIGFSSDLFCFGVRKYMLGYIKRLAVAAVVLRAFSEMMVYTKAQMHPISFLVLLILSFLGFYFAVTGTADMAGGVCAMYGIALPRDRARLSMGTTPDRTFYGIFLSLRHYLTDYLLRPLERRFKGRGYRVLGTLLLFVCTVLLWRTRPETLLCALPLLIFSFLNLLPRVRKFMVGHTAVRMLLPILSVLLCTPLTLALTLSDPLSFWKMIVDVAHSSGSYPFYAVFSVIKDARYLIFLMIALCILMPYAYLYKWLRRRSGARVREILLIGETVLLFAGFLATVIYLAPQFPLYAEQGLYQL